VNKYALFCYFDGNPPCKPLSRLDLHDIFLFIWHKLNRRDVTLAPYRYNIGNHMKLIIRNLSRETTQTALKAMFDAHGVVQSCTLVMDKETGKSKGFGFVEMPKPAEAKAAMKTLNATEVDGCVIRVKKSELKAVAGSTKERAK
jgi:RNA recognition motif-containing protein